jgi:hypothetical protein
MAAVCTREDSLAPCKHSYLFTLAQNHAVTYNLVLRTTLDPTIPLRKGMKPADRDPVFRTLAAQHIDDVVNQLDLHSLNLSATNANEITESVMGAIDQHFAPS